MGSVGRPFATRYLDGFDSALSLGSEGPGKEASKGIMDANGLSPPTPVSVCCSGASAIVASPRFPTASNVGKEPSWRGVPKGRVGGNL